MGLCRQQPCSLYNPWRTDAPPSNTLTFKPGRPGRPRKSLIEWNDPSRQAQVLDWRHRAQEFGLAVDERDEDDGVSRTTEPSACSQDEEPEAFADQPIRATRDDEFEDEPNEPSRRLRPACRARTSTSSASICSTSASASCSRRTRSVEIGERIETAQRDVARGAGRDSRRGADAHRARRSDPHEGRPGGRADPAPRGRRAARRSTSTPVLRAFARIKRRRCLHRQPARRSSTNPRLGAKTRAELETADRPHAARPSSRSSPRSRSARRSSTTSSPSCGRSRRSSARSKQRAARASAPSAAARSRRASGCHAPSSAGASRASRRPRTSCAKPSAS